MLGEKHCAAAPRLVSLALVLLLPACGDLDRGGILGDLGGRDRRTVEYRCDESRRFEVSFRDDGDQAEVRTRDRRYRLDLKDRDGRRRTYGDGDVVLTVEGDNARLRIRDERDYSGCEQR